MHLPTWTLTPYVTSSMAAFVPITSLIAIYMHDFDYKFVSPQEVIHFRIKSGADQKFLFGRVSSSSRQDVSCYQMASCPTAVMPCTEEPQEWCRYLLLTEFHDIQGSSYQILAGNTASGVYHEWPTADKVVNLKQVRELTQIASTQVLALQFEADKSMAIDFSVTWMLSLPFAGSASTDLLGWAVAQNTYWSLGYLDNVASVLKSVSFPTIIFHFCKLT